MSYSGAISRDVGVVADYLLHPLVQTVLLVDRQTKSAVVVSSGVDATKLFFLDNNDTVTTLLFSVYYIARIVTHETTSICIVMFIIS